MTDNDRAAIQAALARVRSSTPVELPAALDALAAAIPAGPTPVVIEPTPEPELDQTELANDLVETLGAHLADLVGPQVSHWLEVRDLALVFYPDEGEWIGQRPAGSITPKAKAELNLRAEITSSLSEAIGSLEFRRGFRKNQGPTYRVY